MKEVFFFLSKSFEFMHQKLRAKKFKKREGTNQMTDAGNLSKTSELFCPPTFWVWCPGIKCRVRVPPPPPPFVVDCCCCCWWCWALLSDDTMTDAMRAAGPPGSGWEPLPAVTPSPAFSGHPLFCKMRTQSAACTFRAKYRAGKKNGIPLIRGSRHLHTIMNL